MVSGLCLKLINSNNYVFLYFVIICRCHFGLVDHTFCQAFSVGRTFTRTSTVASECITLLSFPVVIMFQYCIVLSVHKTLHVFSIAVAYSHSG